MAGGAVEGFGSSMRYDEIEENGYTNHLKLQVR